MCPKDECKSERAKRKCSFTSVIRLLIPPVIDKAEATMFQAPWLEQAHRARRTSSDACDVSNHGSQWTVSCARSADNPWNSPQRNRAHHLHTSARQEQTAICLQHDGFSLVDDGRSGQPDHSGKTALNFLTLTRAIHTSAQQSITSNVLRWTCRQLRSASRTAMRIKCNFQLLCFHFWQFASPCRDLVRWGRQRSYHALSSCSLDNPPRACTKSRVHTVLL